MLQLLEENSPSGQIMRQPEKPSSKPAENAVTRLQRGSNQSGMREYNERLLLTLLRRHGALAKTDIARMTGLSAQTISVIMRSLEQDGLLMKGKPTRVKGKVGQPSVPMSLNPEGAYFLGLKVGRRSADMVLINFLGEMIGNVHQRYDYPMLEDIIRFTLDASASLTAELLPEQRSRVAGLGIGVPFEIWSWVETLGAPQQVLESWKNTDLRAELAAQIALPVYIQNDITAACGAELVISQANQLSDFIYLYIGYFIGGGVVINGSVFSGRNGNAGAFGSMPILDTNGKLTQLLDVASISTLERTLKAEGTDATKLLDSPEEWDVDDAVLEEWIEQCGRHLAFSVVSAMAILEFETALIDGWIPTDVRNRIIASIERNLSQINFAGVAAPTVNPGTLGPDARAMGAATLPLTMKFLVDQNAFVQ